MCRMKAKILLADDESDFLEQLATFLEKEGYRVVQAATPTDTRRKLEDDKGKIDLAIIDLRMERGWDSKDTSGLEVARTAAPHIPKIILTGPEPGSWEIVRETLRLQPEGRSTAVDFVRKLEGREELLRTMRTALDNPSYPFQKKQSRKKLCLILAGGLTITAVVIGAILTLPSLLQWKWLLVHPNGFGLQVAACVVVLGIVGGIIFKKFLPTVIVGVVIAALLSMVPLLGPTPIR